MAKVKIGEVGDFPENEPQKIECDLGTICVVNGINGFKAVDDLCPHETASLSEGEYYDDTDEVECPLHASTFDLTTGEPTAPPAKTPVRVLSVTVDGDAVFAEA